MKVATHKGVEIDFDAGSGKFAATLQGAQLSATTLDDLKAEINKRSKNAFKRVPAWHIRYDGWPEYVELTSITTDNTSRHSGRSTTYRHKGGNIWANDDLHVDGPEASRLKELLANKVEVEKLIREEAKRLKTVLPKVTPGMVDPTITD